MHFTKSNMVKPTVSSDYPVVWIRVPATLQIFTVHNLAVNITDNNSAHAIL